MSNAESTQGADQGRAQAAAQARSLVLKGYPVQLGAWQQEHLDGVQREFVLLDIGNGTGVETNAPTRLLHLARLMRTKYAEDLDESLRVREEAYERGDLTADVPYPAVPGAAELLNAWADVLEAVDRYCEEGELLSLAAPPLLVQLRRWALSELLAQLDGAQPQAWNGPLTRPSPTTEDHLA